MAEARSYNKESLGDISKGDFIAPSAITVLEAAESWLARKVESNGYRHGTLQNWRTHITNYIKPELGQSRIQQVSIDQIETAALKWSEQTSPYTANMALRTLSAIFKRAQRDAPKGRPNNAAIADRIKISNDEETDEAIKPDEVYNQDELKRLIAATTPGSLALPDLGTGSVRPAHR